MRFRDLLGGKEDRLGACDLMEAYSHVTAAAGVTILSERVELGLVVHLAVRVDADTAHYELVRTVEALEVRPEGRLLINLQGQLPDALIGEFDQLH